MTAFRSIYSLAVGALLLAGCATATRDDSDDGSDRQADELGAIPQQNHAAVCSGGRFLCKARVRTDASSHIKAAAAPSGFGPSDLASAYKLNASKSSTATIAIIDAFAYPNAESDLAKYRSQFGLPPCTVANGCLTIDNSQGAGNSPAGDDWTVEAALDLDLASAACPTCKLLFISAKDDQGMGLFTAQAQAVAAGAVAISNSWGGPTDGNDATYDAQYFNHPGVNTFVATGDNGVTASNKPDYPSTSLHVIGVGGTSLVKSTTASRGWTEGAWSKAGSSCSLALAKPSYQANVPSTACTKRAAADLSAVADPNTGLAVYNADNGGWIVVGGTSAASPFVAGVWTRYGLAGANDGSYPYGHAGEFFDVTSGSNGSCTTALCKAGAGWDGPTGIGSPNGASLGGGGSTCTPSCSGKTCGDDGCGGSCGSCGSGQTCNAGTCTGGSACGHAICSTGSALTASCDTCVAKICAADSFCCNNTWDATCVGEVASVCKQSCNGGGGGSTCSHSECNAGAKLTKGCNACVTSICASDSFCCNSKWDSQCVSEVSSVCNESCN